MFVLVNTQDAQAVLGRRFYDAQSQTERVKMAAQYVSCLPFLDLAIMDEWVVLLGLSLWAACLTA